jgi:SAM-dependent methyltransferase
VARPYMFEDRDAGQRRLDAQAGLLEPLTERVFRSAGLQALMRVLELGSGARHLAALVSRLIGPRGRVVGVERDPQAVANARERAAAPGLLRVEFLARCRPLESVDGTFDAVVGRQGSREMCQAGSSTGARHGRIDPRTLPVSPATGPGSGGGPLGARPERSVKQRCDGSSASSPGSLLNSSPGARRAVGNPIQFGRVDSRRLRGGCLVTSASHSLPARTS